ncbi:MAG: hypothetical protein HYX96_08995 [Chloroflexi bacterium]|nr:hypothetical protein [Chloroflexota bacterium]
MDRLRITSGDIQAAAELNDTLTARAISAALPLKGRQRWGDEIYFAVPLSLEQENGQEGVARGDLAYWPEGNAICIFFGPTPVSRGPEPRAASPVTVFGRVTGDTGVFKKVAPGAVIILERQVG